MIGLVKKQQTSEGYLRYTLYQYPRRKKLFKSEQRYIEYLNFEVRDL